jgi:hypothetical protein
MLNFLTLQYFNFNLLVERQNPQVVSRPLGSLPAEYGEGEFPITHCHISRTILYYSLFFHHRKEDDILDSPLRIHMQFCLFSQSAEESAGVVEQLLVSFDLPASSQLRTCRLQLCPKISCICQATQIYFTSRISSQ